MKLLLLKCQHEPVLRTVASTASVRGLRSVHSCFQSIHHTEKPQLHTKSSSFAGTHSQKNHKPRKYCYSGSEENAEPKSLH